jgi:hypothetical protein
MSAEDENSEELKRLGRIAASRSEDRVRQKVAGFRGMYESMSEQDRKQFKDLVDHLGDLHEEARRLRCQPAVKVCVELTLQVGEDEEEKVVATAGLMKRAIAAWDRGEFYTPTMER